LEPDPDNTGEGKRPVKIFHKKFFNFAVKPFALSSGVNGFFLCPLRSCCGFGRKKIAHATALRTRHERHDKKSVADVT
jgi:hypothetical protein